MIEARNDCVGCDGPCLPGCSKGKYTALVCDRCGDEVETLFEWEGEQICEDCLLDEIPHITVDQFN